MVFVLELFGAKLQNKTEMAKKMRRKVSKKKNKMEK